MIRTDTATQCEQAHAYALNEGAAAGSPNYLHRWTEYFRRTPGSNLADRGLTARSLLDYSDRCFALASRHFENMRRAGFPQHRWGRWQTLTDRAWEAYWLAGCDR